MLDHKNPWKTLSGKEVYDNPWVKVTEYQVIKPCGGEGIYGKVAFKNLAIGIYLSMMKVILGWLVSIDIR